MVEEVQAAAPAAVGTGILTRWWAAVWAFARKRPTVLRYALIGSLGYFIYTGLLFVMYDLSIFPFLPGKDTRVDLLLFTHDDALLLITTLIGAEASIIGVFAGHTAWTFAHPHTQPKPLWMRFLQFEARALVSTLGILTVAVNAAVVGLGIHHYIALLAGVLLTFAWNWLWDSRVIWKKDSGRE